MGKQHIGYGRQLIDQEDLDSVLSAMESNNLTQGPMVTRFEQALCEYTGAGYSIVVSSGTAALHIAIAALELEKGQEGITTPNTFVATPNSLIYNNLTPVFADIDPDSYNIDPKKIEEKISHDTAVLLPVHFAGRPCNMEEIKKIADCRGLKIIEDASHAIGSDFANGTKVGSCKYSDMTVFSFHPVKTITTGEGGAITTNSMDLYKKLKMLRSHGITKYPPSFPDTPGPWYYEMQFLGFNYRLTDMQAALGISQLKKLDIFKQKRQKITQQYNDAFSDLDWIKLPKENENACFHLYVIQINFDKIQKTRTQVMETLQLQGIGTQVHYIPVHLQPYYTSRYGYTSQAFPVAETYYEKTLTLPLFPGMNGADVKRVINEVRNLKSL